MQPHKPGECYKNIIALDFKFKSEYSSIDSKRYKTDIYSTLLIFKIQKY